MPIYGDRQVFNEVSINNAPEAHGVYGLYNDTETIYFGQVSEEGITLRSRLQQHKAGEEGDCTQNATVFRVEVTGVTIPRLEELLEEFKGLNGGLPPCNGE